MNIHSIGMLEFNSIAKGIACCDTMLKAANVRLVRSSTVCPGKYVVIISGETADVKQSLQSGKEEAGEYVINEMRIPNAHWQLFPALSGTAQITRRGAVGIVEFFSIASAITAADLAVKAADIDLIEIKIGYAIGGKGVFTCTGEVADVKTAVSAVLQEMKDDGYLLSSAVIARPEPELFDSLM